MPAWVEERAVAVVRERPGYPRSPPYPPSESFPEWPGPARGGEDNPAYRAVRQALFHAGLDAGRFGTPAWNPLGDLARPGETIALKPNLVRHANLGASGSADTDCLVTHGSVLRAVLDYAAKALEGRGRILVADCPVQGARWDEVVRLVGLEEVLADARRRFPGLELAARDFRLTRATAVGGVLLTQRTKERDDAYVELELGADSLLEPLMRGAFAFGVSQYPRERMRRSHAPGRNRYLVPRELLEADLFVNLPKLKSHQKAGLTCALKNLVGVNGHKDYLPHFRYGSPSRGGDEYPDGGPLWQAYWDLAHRGWEGGAARRLWQAGAVACAHALRRLSGVPRERFLQGGGSFHRNDTLWRTILDVNRAFLHWDRASGALVEASPRRYLAVVDGLVGGDRESPLSPAPVPAGLVLAGRNPLAVDTVAAALMRLDWRKIPLLAHGWDAYRWPLAAFAPEQIAVRGLPGVERLDDVVRCGGLLPFQPSCGWRSHVELGGA